ncbi:MAG: nickel pincer cofactor biosynthesis protein LarC [Chloroflexi bacterium]|nr:nickel pincer cofactor biosynthesis protein LarC [Chloroflexota bacterium]
MPRAVYIDCFSGASGDMLLGALLDAGLSLDALRTGLQALRVESWSIETNAVQQHGLHGTRALVRVDQRDQPHRHLADVLRIVRGGALPESVVEGAAQVFQRLAEVEAFIHGTSPQEVEFHEVGALDAIVDVVGVVLGLQLLDVQDVYCSGLPLGSGWANSQHGRIPVPAPATLELMRRAQAPVRAAPHAGETGELVTPTGAALLTVLARFEDAAAVGTVDKVGYGFGSREPAWPNAVRVLVGRGRAGPLMRDTVMQIETNLDDATPEELGYAMERLLEAGALDVAFAPLQMKKNRPGVLLRVLAAPADSERLARLVLEHTSALGVRMQMIERRIAARSQRSVSTPWGDVRVKIKQLGERETISPEYEDCAQIAGAHGLPLADVYAAARKAAAES